MVLRQKPQGGCQGQYISHPWEAVSLATAAKLQHQRTMWCIPGQVGGTLGAWALWREVPDTELSISNPAEPPPGCRNEIRESFTLHRDLYSHLVIDSLGGGLCPHPPLGNCLLLWGWGILEAMLGKKEMLSFYSFFSQSACAQLWRCIHEVHIYGHTYSFSRAASEFCSSSPQQWVN